MLKKAFWTFILVGVIAILVLGAVNRTQARVGESSESDTVAQGEGETHLWLTRTGVVSSKDSERLLVEMESGESIEIGERAWEFAQQAGFSAQPGDVLQLVGFEEGDAFEVGALTNLTNPQNLQIRDPETGRPVWAGRGRRGS